MSDPLSASALEGVPEVNAKFIQYRNVLYGTHSWAMSLDDAGDELATALRDAVLSAERQRLLGMTEEAVVEAAAMAMLTLSLRDAKEVDFAWGAMPQREREKYLALVRAALPLLLAPERARNELLQNALISANEDRDAAVARREQAERERDEEREMRRGAAKEAERMAGLRLAADAEVARLRGALEEIVPWILDPVTNKPREVEAAASRALAEGGRDE